MAERATSTSPREAEEPAIGYGESYFLHSCGVPYERNEHWLKFFDDVADGIVRDFHPATVLDAGCAMGFLVEALRKRGVDASGIDVSEYAISQADESVAEHCRVASVTEPIEGRYDLITCIEVLEHLPPEEAPKAVENLCRATDRLLISSTPEDFGEPTHLNVQPPEYWSALLAQHGFLRDLDHDLSYLSQWAACYVRQEEPLAETVRRYDRSWWRLRREVAEVRKALLQTQEQVAKLEARAEEPPPDEEILRLRDLLIGKEAELGAAKGKLAEFEDRARRLNKARERVEAQIPVFGRLLGRLSRLLSGRRR